MDPYVPIERRPRRRSRPPREALLGRILFFSLVLLALVVGTAGVDYYTDWLWFGALGYLPVFATVLALQGVLFASGAAIFGTVFAINALLARRLANGLDQAGGAADEGLWAYVARVGARVGDQLAYRRLINVGVLGLGFCLSVIMGLWLSSQWELVLRFMNATPFPDVDPIFGQNVGFYVFALPFYRLVHAWLLGTVGFVACTVLAIYAVVVVYEMGGSLERIVYNLPTNVKAHLAALAATMLLLVAANHVLDLFELVYSTRSVAFGAGYADVTAQIPAIWIMTAAAILAAALALATAFTRTVRPAIAGVAVWLGSSILVGLIFPNLIENFEVKPNQLEKERPYIEHSIAMTRRAYGLDQVQEQFYPAEDAVTSEEVRANPETIYNIRLWDHRPLQDTLNQIQSIRAYYGFEDVDVDRYVVNGEYRQVMLAARELNRAALQQSAPSWVNQRLKFTHGYGVAMSLVSAIAEEGRPQLIQQDVPPRGVFQIDRPEIYYGLRGSNPYVIVKTAEKEFDYPRGDTNQESVYEGDGGVNVGSLLPRLAYALKFRDGNLLLSGSLRPESEILYRRSIAERVQRLAPFLILDRDPYIVVSNGQLYWIVDGYTHTNDYPYSERRFCGDAPGLQGRGIPRCGRPLVQLNYIRNSVKAVVNAYDGSTRIYLADPADPLIQTYARAFPGLFLPLSELSADLRAHVRYPEDLFSIQSSVFMTYHMEDPNVFYNKEDTWTLAQEKFDQNQQPVQPYYVIMRVPGETKEEFLLMLPFTPSGKDNMIAWLAARSDGDQYGKMLLYKFPKERLIYGPSQFESRIDQDPVIAAQLALWSQRGSKVIRGNTLVIPVGKSNLYVEPLYLQSDASKGAIPELKQVILSTGSRVVMEPTLEAALTRLFGQQAVGATAIAPNLPAASPGADAAVAPPAAVSGALADLVKSANDHFTRSQEALRAGDWARYGEEQRQLQEALRRLSEQTGP
jgi:uncharacterized membrane protein (UPF0182 family)